MAWLEVTLVHRPSHKALWTMLFPPDLLHGGLLLLSADIGVHGGNNATSVRPKGPLSLTQQKTESCARGPGGRRTCGAARAAQGAARPVPNVYKGRTHI